jgi:hypothetical protein
MALKIVVLEDNNERRALMEDCLADRFYQYERRFFDTTSETIHFLKEHLGEVIAISLDHDLELKTDRHGQAVDCGTGREVADYLSGHAPVCPVIIHSTNTAAALGMEMVLREAQWETKRVIPFGDLEWIPSQWFRAIRKAVVDTAREKTV